MGIDPTCALPLADQIKLIVSDVDGTLLDSNHEFHPRTRSALLKIRKTRPHLQIVLATGKQRTSTADLRLGLNLSSFPAIHLNGCITYSGLPLPLPFASRSNDPSKSSEDHHDNEDDEEVGRVLHRVALDKDVVKRLVTSLAREKALFLYDEGRVYYLAPSSPSAQVDGDGRRWDDILRGYGEDVVSVPVDGPPSMTLEEQTPAAYSYQSLIDAIGDGSLQIIKAATCESITTIQLTRQFLKDNFTPEEFTMTQALPFCIELISSTGSKGTALTRVMEVMGIEKNQVLVFGDGENDVSMFGVSGYAVAMRNAMDSAKDVACYLTGSHDEGGVGMFLERVYGFTYNPNERS